MKNHIIKVHSTTIMSNRLLISTQNIVAPDAKTGNANVSHNYTHSALYSSSIKKRHGHKAQANTLKITLCSGLHKIIFIHYHYIAGWDLALCLENMVIFKATV
jgi:hypothetical protein